MEAPPPTNSTEQRPSASASVSSEPPPETATEPSDPSLTPSLSPSSFSEPQAQVTGQQQRVGPPPPVPWPPAARPSQPRPVGMTMGVPGAGGYHQQGPPPAGPFSTFRSSLGGPNSQVRQPVPGIQTIGMMGSLSTAPTGSQLRPGGIPGQQQQRIGQPQIRSASPSANQTLSSQKFSSHGIPRPPSITSSNTPSALPQSSQSLQQQFWAAQGRQTHAPSLASSQCRPQVKQQFMQPRAQPPQQQQQQQLPMTSHQLQISSSQPQQQKHHHLQQQGSVPNRSQEYLTPRNQQSLEQQHLSSRGQVSQAGASTPKSFDDSDNHDEIVSRKRLRELVSQVDRSEKIRSEVEDDLLEITGDFIESITTAACHLAKHRKSTTLEAKDILLHVERHWNMTLPGFGGDEIKLYKKLSTNDIHKERLSLVKKSMVGTSEGTAKNASSAVGGQAAANPKTHAAKTSAIAIGSPKGREPP